MAIAASTALAVATYLLNILAPGVEGMSRFRVLSPFYHYIEYDPLRTGFSVPHLSVLIGIVAVALALALADVRTTRPGVLNRPGRAAQTANGS